MTKDKNISLKEDHSEEDRLLSVEELNSGLLRTNPDNVKVEVLNQGPPDLKSSTLKHSAMPREKRKTFLPERWTTVEKTVCSQAFNFIQDEDKEGLN